VVLLIPRWRTSDEACWAARQVAGAIACSAEVHVITPQGTTPRVFTDGVFQVHELGTADAISEVRRDLVLASLSRETSKEICEETDGAQHKTSAQRVSTAVLAKSAHSNAHALYDELTRGLPDPWPPAVDLLRGLRPDAAVLADYKQTGALQALEAGCTDVPLALVPLSRELPVLEAEMFAPVLERAACALVFTDAECQAFTEARGSGWAHFVGLPMRPNNSVLREPNPHTGDSKYLFVLASSRLDGDGSLPLTQLIRTRFPSMRVAVSASDGFVVYDNAVPIHRLPALDRRSDLLRLMAWARMTLELRPGTLFARHSIESLLYGTPIVVPERSTAREHAETGSGGLWFDTPAELTWCVEAVSEPEVGATLGRQGRAYAESRYGSTDSFIERTTSALSELVKLSSTRL